ncbi:cytochrome-like protein Fbr [Haloarcula marismortui ATCC 33800]|uniref:Cytochrome-like protein Fbr n=1 Tax=Haloarcula marismortui ATCC 33800 TaxID=662476 RepID=M0K5M3_9EURY|nr:cytochrome-like protein Fbr [Haloarcula sinaiiensis ATCC 33800]
MGIAATGLLAGCPSQGSTESNTASADTDTTEQEATAGTDEGGESGVSVGPMTAVATEWNVYRARLYDAVALGRAGAPGAGATVAQNIFARFEGASGEYGAHEQLESTSESAYEGFEDALGTVQSSLSEGNVSEAASAADKASGHLQTAQQAAAGQQATRVLDLLLLGSRASNAAMAGTLGAFEGAATIAEETMTAFEDALVYSKIETADAESYEAFENALAGIGSAASSEDASGVTEQARDALDATVSGAYALVQPASVAGAGHLATMQARGWDAAAVVSGSGVGADYAHATTLNTYRARVHDAGWLARAGETATAATMVEDVFAHFEGAAAHDALEEADSEAYEAFESGLSDLSSAIENGNTEGVASAVETVDTNLVAGIEALAGGNAPVLQSGFFKARFADARELYRQGQAGQAATLVSDLFARFEENQLDFHETLEETSEDLYHRFEEEHLVGLQSAYENGDDDAVGTHHDGVLAALLEFESAHSAAVASGSGATYMAGLAFDAAATNALGNADRAASTAQGALAFFESGAAGYHEALEEANEDLYHRFEDEALGSVISAANDGGDVYAAAKMFYGAAIESVTAIVGSSGGGETGAGAASVVSDVFATFENAAVHDKLENADAEAYEAYEAALNDYVADLESGSTDGASAFANAARTASFAVVGAVDSAPSGSGGHGGEESEATESSLSGGPNVVEGVPEDADHVVDMQAVAFAPEELTVSVGDTVAWKHAGGEAHNVVAYEEELPDDATYWASGGFESESAAREGWENGEGAVQSGQSYVHTFETAGEHGYFCVPHEAAGMAGTVIVEE